MLEPSVLFIKWFLGLPHSFLTNYERRRPFGWRWRDKDGWSSPCFHPSSPTHSLFNFSCRWILKHCIYSWTKQVSLCAQQWWPPSSFQSKRDFKKLSGRRVFGQLCAAAAVVFSEKLVCTRPSLSSPVWLPVKPAPASWHLWSAASCKDTMPNQRSMLVTPNKKTTLVDRMGRLLELGAAPMDTFPIWSLCSAQMGKQLSALPTLHIV